MPAKRGTSHGPGPRQRASQAGPAHSSFSAPASDRSRREQGRGGAMRKRDLERCRALLLEQRDRILGNESRVLSGELDIDPDDFPDEIDTAVAESSLSFAGQLWGRERRLLNKIERTLEKIDQGTYGECEGCGDEIGAKRLVARPVAGLCIDCKDEQERDERRRE